MINKLEIQNFQSHKNTTLDFVNGVNVIVGVSDCGKSAVLRALRWVMDNKPSGDSIRSVWGGDTMVRITLDSQHTITRMRTNSKNLYYLNDKEFAAFGNDVPDEIKQLLNTSEINIQKQLDKPFMLDSSAGEVAAHFNKVAHLEQIDISMKNINSGIRRLEQEVKAEERTIERKIEQLKDYSFLESAETKLEVLEHTNNQLSQRQNALNNLQSDIGSIKIVVHKLEESVDVSADLQLVEELIDLQNALKEKELIVEKITLQTDVLYSINVKLDKHIKFGRSYDEVCNYIELHQSLNNNEHKYEELAALLVKESALSKQLKELQKNLEIETVVNSLIELQDVIIATTSDKDDLLYIIKQINKFEEMIDTNENELHELEDEFHELFPEQCPLCETYKSTLK